MNKLISKPKRILIVRTDRIGDLVLSTPVIKNLRIAYPDAHIAFMCQPYTKDVVDGNPYLNEIILFDKYNKHKGAWATLKFALELYKKRFDWVIILHPTNRVYILTFLAAIPLRIGWDKKMSFLLTKRIPHKKQEGEKHELEYTLDLLRCLNVVINDNSTYFPITSAAQKYVNELFKKTNLTVNDKIVVIHPSSSCPSRRWPTEYFSQLIKILQETANCKIVLISSLFEKGNSNDIASNNKIIDLRGMLTVAQLGAFLQKISLLISNDSGPVHIAASLGVPVIAIFGRKNKGLSPQRWRPLGDQSIYIHKDVGCVTCLAHNCVKGFLCLRAVTPEEVAEKAKELLSINMKNI